MIQMDPVGNILGNEEHRWSVFGSDKGYLLQEISKVRAQRVKVVKGKTWQDKKPMVEVSFTSTLPTNVVVNSLRHLDLEG